MKKSFKLFTLFLLCVIISLGSVVVGCAKKPEEPTPTPVTVTGITITEEPTKKEYVLNEELNLDGIVVVKNKSDNTTESLQIELCSITGFDSDTVGEKTVVVRYGEFTDTFTVNVVEPEPIVPEWPEYSFTSKTTATVLGENEVFVEDFENTEKLMVEVDKSEVSLTTEEGVAISGRSMLFDTNQAYGKFYVKYSVNFTAGKIYKLEFDLKVIERADTFYIKFYDSADINDDQIGGGTIGKLLHYKYYFTVDTLTSTNAPFIRFMKGQKNERGAFVIDNITINEETRTPYVFSAKETAEKLAEGTTLVDDVESEAKLRMSTDGATLDVTTEENVAISGRSISLTFNQGFGKSYWRNFIEHEVGKAYVLEFDYKVIERASTFYIKFYDGGKEIQFGNSCALNTLQHLVYSFNVYDPMSSGAPMFRIMSGQTSGTSQLIIDNISIKETSVAYDFDAVTEPTSISQGESFVEDFDFEAKMHIGVDKASVSIVDDEDAINNRSLLFESDSAYGKFYISYTVDFQVGETYTVEFDCKVLERADTFYFKFWDGIFIVDEGTDDEIEFGGGEIGEVVHYTFVLSVYEPVSLNAPLFRLMKGQTTGKNVMVIDNFTITQN